NGVVGGIAPGACKYQQHSADAGVSVVCTVCDRSEKLIDRKTQQLSDHALPTLTAITRPSTQRSAPDHTSQSTTILRAPISVIVALTRISRSIGTGFL